MKKKKILVIVVGSILVLILLISGILGFIRYKKDKSNTGEIKEPPVEVKVLIKTVNGEVNSYFSEADENLNKYEYFDFTKEVKTEHKDMLNKIFDLTYVSYDVIKNENNNVLKVTYNTLDVKDIIKEEIETIDTETVTFNFYYTDDNKLKELGLEKIYNLINREKNRRNAFVETAIKELGNTGEKYYTWYGYNYRVEWCAVFVSWLADQNGLLETEIPKFASVKVGAWYYQDKGTWKDNTYTPEPGDIIIFNYDKTDPYDFEHVGIVEKVEDGRIHTIEGNANYKNDPINTAVVRRSYPLKYHKIVGFGVPNYK